MNYYRQYYFGLIAMAALLNCQPKVSGAAQLDFPATEILHTKIQAGDDFGDLSSFDEAVGEKRIVMLDELTHGEGTVFSLKSRLVQYLHQKKGFDVLILESGMYDMHRIWMNNRQTIAEQAPGNIFFMYANSKELQPLFRYLEQQRKTSHPLLLAGFDSRLSGRLSKIQLVSDLGNYLKSIPLTELEQQRWEEFSHLAQLLLSGELKQAAPSVQDSFFGGIRLLLKKLSSHEPAEKEQPFHSAGYWQRITNNLARMAEVAWGIKRFDQHDLEMAANINWMLTEVYRDKKVIIWGHFIHLNRYGWFIKALTQPDKSNETPQVVYKMVQPNKPIDTLQVVANMSSVLHKAWPDDIYIAHFVGAKGHYIDFRDMSLISIKTPANYILGYRMLRDHRRTVFIDGDDLDFDQPEIKKLFTRGPDYKSLIPLTDWKKYWDGIFFFDSIEAVNYSP